MASNLYGGYKSLSELKKANQERYNAATKNSQSISDYISSGGQSATSSGGSSNKSSGSSSNKYHTTVTESNGSKSDGYIQDGVSYYNNGTPINAGASVVDSTGKTWVKGGDPDAGLSIDAYKAKYGVSGASSNSYKPNYGDMGDEIAYNPYEEAYRESQRRLEEMEAQIREQNRLAVEQGTNRLNAQKANINQAADENARQAYVQYMQSQKALPQQLASQGVSGGATETANLGLQTAYQNNVNAINQNKANRLQEIDNAIVDLQNTGDLSTVEQVLANNQAALDAYMNTFDKGVGYNQWANTFNASRIDANREYEAQQIQAYLDAINEENKLISQEKKDEIERTLNGYYKGNFDVGYTSAITGIPVEYLYDTKSALELETKLKNAQTQASINNTNSLIKDRNSSGSGTKPTSASTINSIINTANKMLNEREDVFGDGSVYRNLYDDNAVKAYILSQNITDEEQYNILSNLGLI